jgi:hypothetical protein
MSGHILNSHGGQSLYQQRPASVAVFLRLQDKDTLLSN